MSISFEGTPTLNPLPQRGGRRWRGALWAIMLASSAGPALSDERADIEAACVGLGLGAEPCACIAEDTMERFEQRMREVIYLSLKDEVAFEIMIKAAEVTRDEVIALNRYQQDIELRCRVID